MLTKIAVILLLLIVLFYGGRALSRIGHLTSSRKGQEDRAAATRLVECPRCGAYVPGGRCNCGHGDDRAA